MEPTKPDPRRAGSPTSRISAGGRRRHRPRSAPSAESRPPRIAARRHAPPSPRGTQGRAACRPRHGPPGPNPDRRPDRGSPPGLPASAARDHAAGALRCGEGREPRLEAGAGSGGGERRPLHQRIMHRSITPCSGLESAPDPDPGRWRPPACSVEADLELHRRAPPRLPDECLPPCSLLRRSDHGRSPRTGSMSWRLLPQDSRVIPGRGQPCNPSLPAHTSR